MPQFLTWRDLRDRSTLSVSTLKRLAKDDPHFPRKFCLSPGRVGFRECEAHDWLESLNEFDAA